MPWRGYRACCCVCASHVLSAPRTDTVLAIDRGGPCGCDTVATSCALVAFLCGGADVLHLVVFAAYVVARVGNAFAGTRGRPYHLRRVAEACTIAAP